MTHSTGSIVFFAGTGWNVQAYLLLASLQGSCCEQSCRVCRLIADEAFRKDLVSRIAKVGLAIEEALGSAQDIEGAVEEDGSITVVQTRPQM